MSQFVKGLIRDCRAYPIRENFIIIKTEYVLGIFAKGGGGAAQNIKKLSEPAGTAPMVVKLCIVNKKIP